MSWPKLIVTLLRADPARKIPEKDSPATPLAGLSSCHRAHPLPRPYKPRRRPYVAHLSKSAFQEMKRQKRGAAPERAIAQWIAEHDK